MAQRWRRVYGKGGIDVLKSEIVIKEWEDGARKGILQTIVSLTSDHCIGVKMGTEMLALRKGVAVCTVGAAWEKLKKGEWDIESFRSWYSLKYSFGGRCAKKYSNCEVNGVSKRWKGRGIWCLLTSRQNSDEVQKQAFGGDGWGGREKLWIFESEQVNIRHTSNNLIMPSSQ